MQCVWALEVQESGTRREETEGREAGSGRGHGRPAERQKPAETILRTPWRPTPAEGVQRPLRCPSVRVSVRNPDSPRRLAVGNSASEDVARPRRGWGTLCQRKWLLIAAKIPAPMSLPRGV